MGIDKKGLNWLYGELPGLVSKGILSGDAAVRIRGHYGEVPKTDTSKIALMIFGILGALLIGGGIILILAHNWDKLGRPERTVLAFMPLMAALAAGAYSVMKEKGAVWKEAVGAFTMLASGSSIAIIGQTYHVGGDLESFLLAWMLISFPLIYLFNSTTVAMMFMTGITVRACASSWHSPHIADFWLMSLLAFPHIVFSVRTSRCSARSALLLWTLSICYTICLGVSFESTAHSLRAFAYFGFFALCCLAGSEWFDDAFTVWLRPLSFIGPVGVVFMSILSTYEWMWHDSYRHYGLFGGTDHPKLLLAIAIIVVIYIPLAWLVVMAMRGRKYHSLILGASAAAALLSCMLSRITSDSIPAMLVFNAYLAFIGISLIAAGVRSSRLGKLNMGMAVLSLLIFLRFFDSGLDILLRGLTFIVIGSCFIAANVLMVRRKAVLKRAEGGGQEA